MRTSKTRKQTEMKSIKRKIVALFVLCIGFSSVANAQKTFTDMEQLTVNENVSSIITASEPIKMVDISTDSIVGDKPLDNVIRLKPKTGNCLLYTSPSPRD